LAASRKILILAIARNGRPPGRLYLQALIWLIRLLGYRFATVSQALASPFGRYACITIDGGERAKLTALSPELLNRRIPATLFVSTKGLGLGASTSWKTLRSLKAKGWEIGALGHQVTNLTEQSYRDQRRLVSRAKTLLTANLGMTPLVFAYPFGAYDATTVSCVKDEGFTAAVTMRRGLNNGETSQAPFHLKRLPLAGLLIKDLILVLRTAATRLHPGQNAGGARPSEREGLRIATH
jgi:peptidoglycan/xylan/chitin deacetylase (PgdA/CDA1 family)